MSSPERLDQLIRIVSPKDWFLLAILLTLGAVLIAWCIWGHLPTTVSGQGIIIRPNKIVEIQSQAAGRLADFNLHEGDEVKKGELIGVIDDSPIRRQQEEDRARLAVLEAEDHKQNDLQGQQARLQDRDFTAHQKDLQMQIASLNEGVHDREALRSVFKKRLDALHESIKEGIEPRVSSDLLETEKENLDNEVRISEIDTQRSDLESQINRIETQRTELSRSLLQSSNQRQNQILELRRNIEVAQVQLENSTRILSEYGGRVVEIAGPSGAGRKCRFPIGVPGTAGSGEQSGLCRLFQGGRRQADSSRHEDSGHSGQRSARKVWRNCGRRLVGVRVSCDQGGSGGDAGKPRGRGSNVGERATDRSAGQLGEGRIHL